MDVLSICVKQMLDLWFESEPLKCTLATDAVIGAMVSPTTPGSGYVLLHHVMGEVDGVREAWAFPKGGMGGVTTAIARSAADLGVKIKANCVGPHSLPSSRALRPF
jgi:phytoene dehydrogenase-like protein